MTKKEIVLFISILILSIALYSIFCISKTPGNMVVIYSDGKEYYSHPLDEDKEISVNGEITIKISDSTAYVSYSDCPDKLCQKQGIISEQGKTIICLPNKVSVKIEER